MEDRESHQAGNRRIGYSRIRYEIVSTTTMRLAFRGVSKASLLARQLHRHRLSYLQFRLSGQCDDEDDPFYLLTRRCLSNFSSPTDDLFHGISLRMEQQQGDDDDERHIIKDLSDDDGGGGIIQDAEVVTSKHDKHQTRLLIKEATRAAMLAHYTPSITGGSDENNDSIMKPD